MTVTSILLSDEALEVTGYLAESINGPDSPGILVIQEWWGLNAQILGYADSLAAAGYTAMVPDFFDGRVTDDADEAGHLMSGLDWERAARDLQALILSWQDGTRKLGMVGFCMGGAITLLAASRNPQLDAAVCFYGVPSPDKADLSRITCPLLCHWAMHDGWINAQVIADTESAFRRGGVKFESHLYDTEHAFMNETKPRYNAAAAMLAQQRTLEFFAKHLG